MSNSIAGLAPPRRALVGVALLLLGMTPRALCAQVTLPLSGDSVRLTLGAFVDSYVAFDAGRPPALDRQLTTQAARHAEFNLNLAHVELGLSHPRVRGRFALQAGTSVQANYAGEPRIGTLSGPDVSRSVQEATAGIRVHKTVWIDGGVFFSPYGAENWISRDNWTYTRSLIADNSPYYEAGVKATWQATPAFSAQLHVMNGWQNISETNRDKALGTRLDYRVGDRLAFGYALFAGNEQPDSLPSRLRLFHEVLVRATMHERVQLAATVDRGTQARAGGGQDMWHGGALLARITTGANSAVGLRAEWYHDPAQVIVVLPGSEGLRATGASANLDIGVRGPLLWRTEYRALRSRTPVFETSRAGGDWRRRNHVLVTSLALTF